jgi:hypothetical protein
MPLWKRQGNDPSGTFPISFAIPSSEFEGRGMETSQFKKPLVLMGMRRWGF